MTTQTTHARTSRTRARRLGTLAIAFTTLLSPSGKIIVAVAAAALIGGVATQLRAPASTLIQAPQPAAHTPFRLAHAQPLATAYTHIDSDGEAIPIVLAEGSPASYGSSELGAIPGLTFPGLQGGDAPGPGAQSPRFSAPQGGLPPLRPAHNTYPPGFSRPGGHLTSPPNTQQGTPPGPAAPSGGGAGPQNSGTPNTPPTGSPASPPQLAGPGTPAEKDATPNEAAAPAAPQSGPKTEPGPDEKSAPPNAPDSMPQPETGGPFNPPFPTSPMGPLHTADQPQPQIQQLSRATVPEPSMLGLMLIGVAALAWKARQRLTPVREI